MALNYESITPDLNNSFHYKVFNEQTPNCNNLNWHYHEEIELVYIDKGSGNKGVGSHLSNYTDGDLILIGSNLHHMGFTDNFLDGKTEVVLQFKREFLGLEVYNAPEFKSIKSLLDNANCGLSFADPIKTRVGQALVGIQYETSFQRVLTLLSVLKLLSSSNPTFLNSSNLESLNNNNKLKRLFNFIKYNFQKDLNLALAAEKVSMTVPAFCRYFKKNTGKTFIQFVNEYRANHSAKLLLETNTDIKSICYESGFNNYSNFCRAFKRNYNTTPKNFRDNFFVKLKSE